jgi:hypothetical protein
MRRSALLHRHDAVVRALHSFMLSQDWMCTVEPRVNYERKKPDLDISIGLDRFLLDVAIIEPCEISHASSAARDPHRCLITMEGTKIGKYAGMSADCRATFVPFVLNAFGGFGPAACRFLQQLRNYVSAFNDPAVVPDLNPVDDLVRSITAVLHKGNASAVSLVRSTVAGLRLRRPQDMDVDAAASVDSGDDAAAGVAGVAAASDSAPRHHRGRRRRRSPS